jgi:branched-chain amino acid transport system substrate-binding protein
VEQDHVFAVIANSAITFSAAPYLASQGVPVVGAAIDSTEWITDRNMFSIIGTQDYTKVYSQYGTIYKKLGVTNLASIGYSISPSSAGAANGIAAAVKLVGIKVGYLNASFPFGSTNTDPVALALKSDGVNGLSASIETTTEFALINQLKDEGLKVTVLNATGYGGDLFLGGAGGVRTAQGEYFLTSFEPIELHSAQTEQLSYAMKTYAGVKGDPTFAEYQGYLSVEALLDGLKAAGSNPTQASFVNALLKMGTFNGGGLYGPGHSVGFAMDLRGKVSGADNCLYILKFSGTTFHLVPGMDPICGKTIAGETVPD